jgi:uncharacterized protein YyaL (SSP411 family)
VLHRAAGLDALQTARLAGWRERLLAARGERVRPARDDNILTGWNGLMIEGLCAAFQATGIPEYLSAAQRAANFIQGELTLPDGGVYRAWNDGIAKMPGFLEDYAFLCNAARFKPGLHAGGLMRLPWSIMAAHFLQAWCMHESVRQRGSEAA